MNTREADSTSASLFAFMREKCAVHEETVNFP